MMMIYLNLVKENKCDEEPMMTRLMLSQTKYDTIASGNINLCQVSFKGLASVEKIRILSSDNLLN